MAKTKIKIKTSSSTKQSVAAISKKTNTKKVADMPIKVSKFPTIFAWLSLAVLLFTTIFWAILDANLQSSNADQSVNSFLFEDSRTFHGSLLPGAHSFLIKWPLFLAVKLFGYSNGAFLAVTTILAVVTVGFLAYVLYKIERRKLVFGTLCLALASVLLLVPAVPYSGALLPVNMAMLTTRNLEYAWYILAIILFLRSPKLISWLSWLAIGLLVLLFASDKLFLAVGLGGALVAVIIYGLIGRWSLVSLSVNWLVGGLIATAGAIGLLTLLSARHVVYISVSGGLGPYGAVHSAHSLFLAILYSILGFATNFGANPAFSATVLRDLPHSFIRAMLGTGGVSYTVNFVVLGFGLLAAYKTLRLTLMGGRVKKFSETLPFKLSIVLIWTTVAALGEFIFSNHYYPVDARYLTIALFTLFICMATYGQKLKWRPERVAVVGLILSIGIFFGVFTALNNYHQNKNALAAQNQRNSLVAQALSGDKSATLVGDYWRVMPIKLIAPRQIKVLPLANCTTVRSTLTSQAWQADLHRNSFVYLLSLGGSLTDYPRCTIDQVTSVYGRPNKSALIAGSLSSPKELLLFYDHGINNSAPSVVTRLPSTVLPITPEDLPQTACPVPTSMNIVAHQDDDLLFLNPDILHDIQNGHCVRTVYITGGDSGFNYYYWLNRQRGSEAAYSKMLGASGIWVERIVKLSAGHYISVANPKGNSQISLIFMHLPDGNLTGQGFAASRFQSLQSLDSGNIKTINSVDGQSVYTSKDLITALSDLMHLYLPSQIRTQSNFQGKLYPDHSDHIITGRYVKKAYAQYEKQQFEGSVTIPINYYVGYPVHQFNDNISDGDLKLKQDAFLVYAGFDGSVCQTVQQCDQTTTYGSYLRRQYQINN